MICGKNKLVAKQDLQKGKTKNCGNHRPYNDISGQVFGFLKAVRVCENPPSYMHNNGTDGTKVWECKCLRCGKTCYARYSSLKNGDKQSCGCLGKNRLSMEISQCGTSPKLLHSRKLNKNNNSGYTGVFFESSRGKWTAKITFRRKVYQLGRFDKKEDAIAVRKIAEEKIFGGFLKWYASEYPEQWKKITKGKKEDE